MNKYIPLILVIAAFVISVVVFFYVKAYPIDEATFRKQLEQKIDKIKPNTPVLIKHWDGTEFNIIFVENPKDQLDIILVRVWGKVLPMEKGLIEKIERK